MNILGITLTHNEHEKIVYCHLKEDFEKTDFLSSDQEILELVDELNPDIVVFQTPLSLPEKGNIRVAEEELLKKNIKIVAPRGLLTMEKLTLRGSHLKDEIQKKGSLVIETSTEAFYHLMRFPKTNNRLEVKRLLKLFDIELPRKDFSQKQIDSLVAAFTGRLFLEAKVEFFGTEEEGQIVLPKIR